MRGQKRKNNEQMRRGRTIVAEREHAESDSERMRARMKARRKHDYAVLIVGLIIAILALCVYMGVKEVSRVRTEAELNEKKPKAQITAQIVDEDERGQISTRMREYIAQLEQDFLDLGYRVVKVTLPTGMTRTLYIDLNGIEGVYFKVNLDRGTAVTAEDAVRMLDYLQKHDLHPAYVDVRTQGKAYYQ